MWIFHEDIMGISSRRGIRSLKKNPLKPMFCSPIDFFGPAFCQGKLHFFSGEAQN